jgi:hypothetical protein
MQMYLTFSLSPSLGLPPSSRCIATQMTDCYWPEESFLSLNGFHYTVKRVDEVVRHPHLVTKDQFSLVSEKVFGIPEDNFTINIELF